MPGVGRTLFESDVWTPALDKFAGVTRLTIALYDAEGHCVCGPVHPTPLSEFFAQSPFGPRLFADSLERCFRRAPSRTGIVFLERLGVAVIGAPLVLNGTIAGAAVAGYHLLEFPQSIAIERLAREAALPAARLWDL